MKSTLTEQINGGSRRQALTAKVAKAVLAFGLLGAAVVGTISLAAAAVSALSFGTSLPDLWAIPAQDVFGVGMDFDNGF